MKRTKKEILNGVEGIKSSKIVANNTIKIITESGDTLIRLHDTNIITIKPDGNYVLTSGGWRTPTTKDRLNRFAPFRITQTGGQWYIKEALFFDGIELTPGGDIINGISESAQKTKLKDISKLKKSIAKFIKRIDDFETLPTPDSGDCWYCLMRTEDGQTLGDISGPCHLTSHIEEGYVPGSLLVNAMEFLGYNHSQIGLHYQMDLRDTFKRALRRYLYKKLGV